MSRGTWKPDCKKYNGPDEDGKYLFKIENKKQQRMLEHGNRLSGGGGGEVREMEERRKKFYAHVKAEKAKLQERSLLEVRARFKQFDGVDNLLVEVNRRKKAHGTITIDVDNNHLTKNKKLSSVVTIGIGKWADVLVHEIEPNEYYLLEVRYIRVKSWGLMGAVDEPCNLPEEEWGRYVDKYFTLDDPASYDSLRIYRRDEVRSEKVDVAVAKEEIRLSQYEIPEKKQKRGKK